MRRFFISLENFVIEWEEFEEFFEMPFEVLFIIENYTDCIGMFGSKLPNIDWYQNAKHLSKCRSLCLE